ncbi:TPA: PAAR domain-containing protein [Providencia alcalifaciens]
MSRPAARVSDMHICPAVTPGTPPVPHVGGPILPQGIPKVLIGGVPAATVGSEAICVGATDNIVTGSLKVMIGNKPAARVGDTCSHGGTIVSGYLKVLIG